jgi:hypothetical protein
MYLPDNVEKTYLKAIYFLFKSFFLAKKILD